MTDKGKLLDRFARDGEERILLGRVLDRMETSRRRNILSSTGFLNPREQEVSARLLEAAGDGENIVFFGGYEQAERKILLFLPDYMTAEEIQEEDAGPLQGLRAEFAPENRLTHRDFLGSLMGLGVRRDCIGDLLVSEDGCDFPVLREVADWILSGMEKAGRAELRLAPVSLKDLRIPEGKTRLFRDTVAALRLDSVAAAGFSLSRSAAADLVAAGRAQVNWQDCQKPDRLLREGDAVTVRGLGKIVLEHVGGATRKGRISVEIKRYL
ncbi:RNA-binding protein [Papillibacter cinnamivorans]|uniref:RNA-binding protein YlmH, contains S4-like domain n=1 Tax=Papillibacter cinnamivorans DSM 12816 TaxID=1122930 RepID=A0A1W2A0A4_9FIRM|nr:YlmH/Sll1252 family protein [Papillibacter cinnamivorans]SMC54070.1 RNA-binding protein YlmH, contains S4-like domain [Papillibacter cinnamivorans DSM 12816]